MLMNTKQRFVLWGVTVFALVLPLAGFFPAVSSAVPINAADKAADEAVENSSDRSDAAGWMQAGKVLSTRPSADDKTAPPMQACLKREEGISQKISLINTNAQDYEKKLTTIFEAIVELKREYKIDSSEIDTLIMASANIRADQVEPLLESLAVYKADKKIACSQGIDSVISQLFQVQNITQELKEGLSEYRNSIRAVLFAVRDHS